MKLMWGADQVGNANNATRFVWTTSAVKNAAGFVCGLRGRCLVTEGYLTFDGQAAAKTAMDTLFASARGQRRNLKFLNDDNSDTTTVINNADTEGGVYWDTLTWTDDPGGQYATFRKFNAEFSWEVTLLDTWQKANLLVDYSETIVIDGGVNLFRTHQPVNRNVAVQQTTSLAKMWTVTQQGFAVGWEQQPAANAPISADSPPLKRRSVEYKSGERIGDNIRRKRTTWLYTFEYTTAPTVVPTQWTGAFTGP